MMKENMNPLLVGALSLSVLLNIMHFMSAPDDELNKAASELSNFGAEIGRVTKNNPVTQRQKQQISDLARIPVPISKGIKKNAVIASGINNDNAKPIVLKSDTGEEVQPCGRIENKDNNIQGCDIQIIDPTEELANALNVNKPIHGKILKNGKEIPATFVVEVKAVYKGSWCQTYASGGSLYTYCWDLPNF